MGPYSEKKVLILNLQWILQNRLTSVTKGMEEINGASQKGELWDF